MAFACAGSDASLAVFLLRIKNIANKDIRIATASPTPTPIPAAAPVDSPPPDEVPEDDPVEVGEVESLVAVAASSMPVAMVVVGATASAVRLVVGYVCVTISQGMFYDLIVQKDLTFTVEYRSSPMVLKLANVKCSPDCVERMFESIAINPESSTFSRQFDPLARFEK